MRERDVGVKATLRGDERPILDPRHRAADECLLDRHAGRSITYAGFLAAARNAARMRCGVAGISSIDTPKGTSASLMALITAAGAPIVPPSPSPLALVIEAGVSVSR